MSRSRGLTATVPGAHQGHRFPENEASFIGLSNTGISVRNNIRLPQRKFMSIRDFPFYFKRGLVLHIQLSGCSSWQ